MFIITLVGFVIAVNAPGDPVERMLSSSSASGESTANLANKEGNRKKYREMLGLDLPVFYFALNKSSYPDTLYRIYNRLERESLSRLLDEYGSWNEISDYHNKLNSLHYKARALRSELGDAIAGNNAALETLNNFTFTSLSLKSDHKPDVIRFKLQKLGRLFASSPFLRPLKDELEQATVAYGNVFIKTTGWKNYIPKLNFYANNQYHRWLFGDGKHTNGLLRFDFGVSLQNGERVTDKIKERIPWSMFFSIASILLSYIISIPLGVFAAQYRGSKFDRISSFILYAMFSLPSFFVALMLITFFSNPDFLGWLPALGVKPAEGYPDDAGFFERAWISLPYIILPLLSYTYHSFAYLSRTTRASVLEAINQDYIRTARAKGLSEYKVVWKHAFRNSLLPLITLFANIFPAAIGGSIIIEYIFTIPGMGNEIVQSTFANDHPMIVAVLTITGLLTLVGYLVSDILYSIADPRIKT